MNFKPINVIKKLEKTLPKRAREVLEMRYGVGSSTEKQTLEAIGQKYGITRERVRQIEDHALKAVRASKVLKEEHPNFEELKEEVTSMGGIVSETELLNRLAKDKKNQNAIHLMLVIGDAFNKEKESDDFKINWYVNKDLAEKVKTALKKLYSSIDDEQITAESVFIQKFLDEVKDLSEQYKNEEIVKRWLSISKKLDKNPLGEWGKTNAPGIHVRGVRDYAYLIMRQKGVPVHFKDVAKAIYESFKKRVHVATCHNELIRDSRFVLVGRGMYALKEWGYSTGVVKDVIKTIESPKTEKQKP
jgi:hypothetical protein